MIKKFYVKQFTLALAQAKWFQVLLCITNNSFNCPVGWGCRIHRLLLCRRVRTPNECPGYDTKQSDGEVPAMLELWGMQSTLSLPSLPGPLRPGVVAPDKGPMYELNRTIYHASFTLLKLPALILKK